jgi:SulP family sulfate permease
VVKHAFSGESFRSNVDRPKLYRQLLHRKGGRIHVFELQGFIFFGTANKLLAQVRQRVNDRQQQSPRFLLLDFRQVNGLDASAMLSFNKIKQLAQTEKITLLFTHLSPIVRKKMEKDVLTRADAGLWQVFDDLNHGMAWCEEQIIADIESTGLTAKSRTALQQLEAHLPAPDGLQRLKACCEKMEAPAGQVLITQGKLSKGLFFIETGGAEATLQLGEGKSTRLRKMSAGTIVGEVSVYASHPATAMVTTDQPSLIYFLSNEKIEEIEKEHPGLAAALHRFMAQLVSERLADSTDVLEALLK